MNYAQDLRDRDVNLVCHYTELALFWYLYYTTSLSLLSTIISHSEKIFKKRLASQVHILYLQAANLRVGAATRRARVSNIEIPGVPDLQV